jgi:hypothetical protein
LTKVGVKTHRLMEITVCKLHTCLL